MDFIQIDAGVSNMSIQDLNGKDVPAEGLPADFRGYLIVNVFNDDFNSQIPAGTVKWSVSLGTFLETDEGFESDMFDMTRKKFGAGAVQAWLIPKEDIDPRVQLDLKVPIRCFRVGSSKVVCNVINIAVDRVSNTNLNDKSAVLVISNT